MAVAPDHGYVETENPFEDAEEGADEAAAEA